VRPTPRHEDAGGSWDREWRVLFGIALACVALVAYTLAGALQQDGDSRGVDDTIADVCTITFYISIATLVGLFVIALGRRVRRPN